MVYLYDPSTAPTGAFHYKDILKFMGDRLHTSRVFRQRIVEVPLNLDRPYWIEDGNFNLENHVRHNALPEPGDWQQFCGTISRLHSIPLDRSRPLWEMHLIKGLDNVEGLSKDSFAIFIKIHHAAIDGFTAAEITGALHSFSSEQMAPPPITKEWVPEEEPDLTTMVNKAAINLGYKSPLKLWKKSLKLAPKMPQAILGKASGVTKGIASLPKTRFSAEVGPQRVFDSCAFDLKDFGKIRKLVDGSTVTDVLLAVCGGGLRKYLDAKGELPKKSLVSLTPINVRTEKEHGSAGNQVSLMNVGICSNIADPLERLQAVRNNSEKVKRKMSKLGARELTDINNQLPGALHCLALRVAMDTRLGAKYPVWNTVVSSVPGPQIPLYMNGAKLVRFMGMGPVLDGLGIVFPCISYNGRIEITLIACRDILPDPEFMAECLQESFDELKAVALLQAKEPKVKATAAAAKTKKPTVKKTAAAAKTKEPTVKKTAAAAKTKQPTAKKTAALPKAK
jgi:WS/DGAT/MGAT family acyltransferase